MLISGFILKVTLYDDKSIFLVKVNIYEYYLSLYPKPPRLEFMSLESIL